MNQIVKDVYGKISKYLPSGIYNKLEYKGQKFMELNERPIEFGFVFKSISKTGPRTILDVGSGTTALPHLMRNCGPKVTAIDNIRDYWPSGMKNRHYHVLDKDITASGLKFDEQFDLITCISVLEHIEDHDSAMKNMFAHLKRGGHMVLTCPYTENNYVKDTYKLPNSNAINKNVPFVCQSYSRAKLSEWMTQNNGEIVEQEYWKIFSGDCWSIGERIVPSVQVNREDLHQLTCLLIKKK